VPATRRFCSTVSYDSRTAVPPNGGQRLLGVLQRHCYCRCQCRCPVAVASAAAAAALPPPLRRRCCCCSGGGHRLNPAQAASRKTAHYQDVRLHIACCCRLRAACRSHCPFESGTAQIKCKHDSKAGRHSTPRRRQVKNALDHNEGK